MIYGSSSNNQHALGGHGVAYLFHMILYNVTNGRSLTSKTPYPPSGYRQKKPRLDILHLSVSVLRF